MEVGREVGIAEGHKDIFRDDVYYFDRGGSLTGVHIYQNLPNYILSMCSLLHVNYNNKDGKMFMKTHRTWLNHECINRVLTSLSAYHPFNTSNIINAPVF